MEDVEGAHITIATGKNPIIRKLYTNKGVLEKKIHDFHKS